MSSCRIKKRTVSVRLDPQAERRLEKAADLTKQSRGAFLEKAGDEAARRVLLEWAVVQYREGNRSFGELAGETGLAIEEIMRAMGDHGRDEALAMFLASCRTVAKFNSDPEFLRLAEQAVQALEAEPS